MSTPLDRGKRYRYLAGEFLRLAASDASIESRNYYLQMAEHYITLAQSAELKTNANAQEPRLGTSTVAT
jgi:hypothetical protein